MRTDYTQHDVLFPDDPESPSKHPSLLINNDGVFLLTCRDHGAKIDRQYLHLPQHPAGRVFSPIGDRFAPAVLSTRTMKPFRENYSTASYKMLKLNSSFAGLNTCFLSENRVFDRVSDQSVQHETFYLHARRDTQLVLKQFVAKGLLSQQTAEELLNSRNDEWLQKVEFLKKFSNFVPLETVAFLRYMNELREQPLTSIPENDELMDVLLENDELIDVLETDYFQDVDSEQSHSDEESSDQGPTSSAAPISTESNSAHTSFDLKKLDYSCVKVMDRNLGAPPTTFVVDNQKEKIVIDLTANSVLFMSKIVSRYLIRHQLSWKVLNCFSNRKCAKKSFKHALRLLERELENASMYEMFIRLPFVNLISVQSRNDVLDLTTVDPDKDFQVFISSCTQMRYALPPQDDIEFNDQRFRLVYVMEDKLEGGFFFRYKYCKRWWDIRTPGHPVPSDEIEISNLLHNNCWKVAIFEKVDSKLCMKEKNMSTSNIFGQSVTYCNEHKLPLACDFPKNRFVCQ